MAGSANLSASITMTNGASAVLKQVQGDIERTNAQAAKSTAAASSMGAGWAKAAVGFGAAAVSIGSLTRFIGDSIAAAAEDQKSVTSLGVALNNLGLGSANAEMQGWTKSIQLATGASDDLIRSGLTRLVSATGDVETAQKAVLLSMDIAAGGYTDQTAAAKALSAAYLGNTAGLARLKLPLDAAILKSGDMKRITAELTKVVGGQAAAAAETYAGKMQRVSTALDEAKESAGYGFLQVLDELGNQLGGSDGAVSLIDQAGTGLQRWGEGIASATQFLGLMSGALRDVIPGVDGYTDSLESAISMQGGLAGMFFASPMSNFGNTIEALTAIVDRNSESWAKFASKIDGATASYKDADGKWHTYINGIEQFTAGAGAAADGQGDLADGVDGVGDAAGTAAPKVSRLAEALGLLDVKTGQRQALIAWRQGLTDFVEKPSRDAALDLVSNFQSAYDSFKDGGKKQAQFVVDNYAAMKRTINRSGLSEAAQAELLDPLNDAKAAADLLLTSLNLLDGKRVSVSVVMSQLGAAAPHVTGNGTYDNGGGYNPNATRPWLSANGDDSWAVGGYITGPGTGISDSIPARLSNGEYVVKASSVAKYGVGFMDMLNAQGFAAGGRAGSAASAVSAAAKQVAANNVNGWYMNAAQQPGDDIFQTLLDQANWQYETNLKNQQDAADRADKAAQDAADANAKARKAADDAAEQARRDAEEKHRQEQAVIAAARKVVEEAAGSRNDFAKAVATGGINYGSILGYSAGGSDWATLSARAPGSDGAGGPATSGGSISAYMSGRLARVKSFGQVIKDLNLAGLNSSTLREVIAAGPDEGYTLGKALLDAGVGEIGNVNSIQTQLEDTSAGIGAYAGNRIYGGGVMDAYGNYTNVVAANGGVDDTPLQVNLVLDSQLVVTQLLQLKRDKGGLSLGFD